MGRLDGKIAIVTAAGQGIGKATVQEFVREGAKSIIAVDINESFLTDLSSLKGVTTVAIDLTNTNHLDQLVADLKTKHGLNSVDILFNCAGFVHHGSLLDCDESSWDFSFNLNVRSMFMMTKRILPFVIAAGGGSIVNMSSVVSSVKGTLNRCAYGASKAAVIGLTKSIAADYIANGVRCNAICPGTCDTPSLRDRVQQSSDPEKAMSDFIARQKMGRLGTAAEVAKLVVYLASDESVFCTGREHVIDGGWSI